MAVNMSTSDANSISIRISSFLGSMYIANEAMNTILEDLRTSGTVTDEETKRGFSGNSGPSGKARAWLRERKFAFVGSVSGTLSSVSIREVDGEKGMKHPYLNVVLRDGGEKFYISAPMTGGHAQMLIRKLANAQIGIETEIALFSTHDGQYGNPGASLKQNNAEVKGIDPSITLAPAVKAATDALIAAGVPVSDKLTFRNRRQAVNVDYHTNLVNEIIKPKVDSYYHVTDNSAPTPHKVFNNLSGKTAGDNGSKRQFDDFGEEDIPF